MSRRVGRAGEESSGPVVGLDEHAELPARAVGAVLLLLQPALAAVWGVALLNETLIAVQVAGIAILLLGVTIARPRAEPAAGAGCEE